MGARPIIFAAKPAGKSFRQRLENISNHDLRNAKHSLYRSFSILMRKWISNPIRERRERILFDYDFRDGRIPELVYDRFSPRSRAAGCPVDVRAGRPQPQAGTRSRLASRRVVRPLTGRPAGFAAEKKLTSGAACPLQWAGDLVLQGPQSAITPLWQ
jgi:hypothetical protein